MLYRGWTAGPDNYGGIDHEANQIPQRTKVRRAEQHN